MNGYFLGGYGTVLGQMFGRNFPNYSAGISLNIPIRNRAAQADYITDQLNYRQQQIQDRQLQNNIRQNVINARIALARRGRRMTPASRPVNCRNRLRRARAGNTNWALPRFWMW